MVHRQVLDDDGDDHQKTGNLFERDNIQNKELV